MLAAIAGAAVHIGAQLGRRLTSLRGGNRGVPSIAAQAHVRDASFMESLLNKKIAIKEGQNEERLFSIREGEVVVGRNTPGGYLPLARLEKGDFFGHIPF